MSSRSFPRPSSSGTSAHAAARRLCQVTFSWIVSKRVFCIQVVATTKALGMLTCTGIARPNSGSQRPNTRTVASARERVLTSGSSVDNSRTRPGLQRWNAGRQCRWRCFPQLCEVSTLVNLSTAVHCLQWLFARVSRCVLRRLACSAKESTADVPADSMLVRT
jgi:hypothetical protein